MVGDFFAKFSRFVAIQITRMVLSSNWGCPPNFGGAGGANIGHFWMGAWETPPGDDIMQT